MPEGREGEKERDGEAREREKGGGDRDSLSKLCEKVNIIWCVHGQRHIGNDCTISIFLVTYTVHVSIPF